MRLLLFFILIIFVSITSTAQITLSQAGIMTEDNLRAIGNLSSHSSSGAYAFDNRYEGIKGTPRLLDTLLPSSLWITGQNNRIQLVSDIDLVQNTIIYMHPRTKVLYSVQAENVHELTILKDGREILFRTTGGKHFEKELRKNRFYQVLNDGKYHLIRIPSKILVKADYKGAYSADRKYDEYQLNNKYYLSGTDSIFHQVQLTRKAFLKLFPEKKELIENAFDDKSASGNEEIVLSLLEKL